MNFSADTNGCLNPEIPIAGKAEFYVCLMAKKRIYLGLLAGRGQEVHICRNALSTVKE